MIDPSECFAGSISAAKEMTLVLPRTSYEHSCLIAVNEGKLIGICLDELHQLGRFFAFECTKNDDWKGLHVLGVRIELDETSLYDAEGRSAPRGSMVRLEDKLALRVQLEGTYHATSVAIVDGLPACAPQQSACFLKWQIVLGEGEAKRIFMKVDATQAER